jgi:phospho-N-acetylmuramoyl-pentapeptide-transferase
VSFAVAATISILWGKYFISWMKRKQFGQIVRDDGPESHFKKAGTPTMGGVFLVGSVVGALLITGNFNSHPLLITLFVLVSYFCLGFLDDFLKIGKKNTKGISARGKLLWQLITAGLAGFFLLKFNVVDSTLHVPFLKGVNYQLGWFFVPFIMFVIVGSSNAVNLTYGLDGLAIGTIMTSVLALGVSSYASGHSEISNYLYIPYVENSGELAVLAMAVFGAGVGFLWYNSYPAQIFMGDVGSLSLGGMLGIMAVLCKSELLFSIIGGVFVVETFSVILQVASYKTRKKRIFKMAPIHHHFELLGWPEPKVIVRFWIISIFLALVSIATLKMR